MKNKMFQYATQIGVFENGYSLSLDTKIYEDTDLLSEEEAQKLWDKYYPQVVRELEENQRPQMCIWKDCKTNTDYGTVEKEIDWRDDLEVKNGKVYKKSLQEI